MTIVSSFAAGLQPVFQAYARHGLLGLAWRGVRPLTPGGRQIRYGGMVIGHRRFGGPPFDDVPDYEEALIKALRENVRADDKVVVIGGGYGVTCAVAATLSRNKVICFEGGHAQVEETRNTARLNALADQVEVVHAVVGEAILVHSDQPAKGILSPSDLPSCDILEMDCEGAECKILSDMKITPRVVAVETHAVYDAPSEKVRQILEKRGYRVENRGVAEPRLAEDCKRNGIEVLVGKLHS